MYKLRTTDNYGKEILHPENAPIINIQCNDPIIDLLDNFIDSSDDRNEYTLADLIRTIQFDVEHNSEFLKNDLNRLFEAVGVNE